MALNEFEAAQIHSIIEKIAAAMNKEEVDPLVFSTMKGLIHSFYPGYLNMVLNHLVNISDTGVSFRPGRYAVFQDFLNAELKFLVTYE